MKPLPNLDDIEAMAARGRRSALMSSRNEACAGLRDCAVYINNGDLLERIEMITQAETWLERLREIAELMRTLPIRSTWESE